MKKRFLVMILVLALLLAGCGTKSRGEVSGKLEETPVAETVEEAAPARMGVMEGGTYTNTYTGYGFTLGSDWTIYGAEELQDLPDMIQDQVAGTELGDYMEGMEEFNDVMAENMETFTSINVLYQKQSLETRLGNAILSERELVEGVLEMQDEMMEAYAQAGIAVAYMEAVEVTFLGQTRVALRTVSEVEGIPYYTLQLFDNDLGSYAVTLTLGSFLEDNTESLLELFYPVN